MALLTLIIIATLLATTTATTSMWTPTGGLSVEQPGCPENVMVNQGLIIDIKASIDFGAELLSGEKQPSFSSCVAVCCGMENCDMALYKTDGYSESGKNCYYVHCGAPENCRMVEHEGFVIATLPGSEYSETGLGREGENTNGNAMAPYTPTPPLPPPTPPTQPVIEEETTTDTLDEETSPTSSVPPTELDQIQVTEDDDPTVETVENPDTQTSNSNTTTTLDPDSIPITEADSIPTPDSELEESESETETSESDMSKSESEISKSESEMSASGAKPEHTGTENGNEGSAYAMKEQTDERPVVTSGNSGNKHDCDQDGCDGAGLIVVAVIGSVCLLILVVLAAVIIKKLADRRRKKRFQNVDYLINGMYA